MEEKLQEVKKAMLALGYSGTNRIELETLDEDRYKVIYSGHLTIGIYDFVKHTFID